MPTSPAQPFAHCYWIGGSPCAGKSSVAQALATQFNLTYYACDAAFPAHQARAHPVHQPTLHRLATLASDAIWLPPVAEQVARVQAIYREEFALMLEDLRTFPADQPLLVEGAALLPVLVASYLTDWRRAIWITPTPRFQRTHYAQRPWVHTVLQACSDPAQGFQNWMARDEAFARWVKQEATHWGLRLLEVDGQQSLADMTALVAAWFGLGG